MLYVPERIMDWRHGLGLLYVVPLVRSDLFALLAFNKSHRVALWSTWPCFRQRGKTFPRALSTTLKLLLAYFKARIGSSWWWLLQWDYFMNLPSVIACCCSVVLHMPCNANNCITTVFVDKWSAAIVLTNSDWMWCGWNGPQYSITFDDDDDNRHAETSEAPLIVDWPALEH